MDLDHILAVATIIGSVAIAGLMWYYLMEKE
jgi:hypothetical protein